MMFEKPSASSSWLDDSSSPEYSSLNFKIFQISFELAAPPGQSTKRPKKVNQRMKSKGEKGKPAYFWGHLPHRNLELKPCSLASEHSCSLKWKLSGLRLQQKVNLKRLERTQKKRNQLMTSLRMIKGVAGQPETGVESHGQFLVLSGDPPVPSQPSLVLTPPNWICIYIYRKPNGQLETTTCNPWHLMPPSSSPLEQPKLHMQVLALDSKQILYSQLSFCICCQD